jgi:endonuclease V
MNISKEQLSIWEEFQNNMKKEVITKDSSEDFFNKIKYIGGVDISFDKNDPNKCCVYLIVLDFKNLSVVYEDYKNETLTIPYISGFLGFREVSHYKDFITKLKQSKPELLPDIILVDGFGTLHQREYGSASHLGVECDIATIG